MSFILAFKKNTNQVSVDGRDEIETFLGNEKLKIKEIIPRPSYAFYTGVIVPGKRKLSLY